MCQLNTIGERQGAQELRIGGNTDEDSTLLESDSIL